MEEWFATFAINAGIISAIIAIGWWRIVTHRRFRVRGTLPTSARLERSERWYVRSALVVGVGFLLVTARLSGGPSWTGRIGNIVTIAGFLALSISLVVYLIERFKLPNKQRTRTAA